MFVSGLRERRIFSLVIVVIVIVSFSGFGFRVLFVICDVWLVFGFGILSVLF